MVKTKILQLSQILWHINHDFVVHFPGNWSTEKIKFSQLIQEYFGHPLRKYTQKKPGDLHKYTFTKCF